MVDGPGRGCFGYLIRRLLVFWFVGFLFCWIRAEGFPGVYVGLLDFFFLSWDAGFLLFPSFFFFFVGPLVFLFSFSFWGLRGSEPWGWL